MNSFFVVYPGRNLVSNGSRPELFSKFLLLHNFSRSLVRELQVQFLVSLIWLNFMSLGLLSI